MRIRRNTNISNASVFHLALVTMAALVRHVITEDCGQEELVQCTRPLQVLSATSELSFVTKKEELDKLCPDLHKGLHCIRSYTRRCMNIHQRDHFNKLYHGTNEVIHELCEEGPYQEDFLRHAPCMRHVKKDYEVCAVQYQSTMTKIGQTVATTTTTTVASSIYPTMPTHLAAVLSNGGGQYHGSDMSQHHHHRQHEHSGGAHPNSTKSIEDAEEKRLKTVCCDLHKGLHCIRSYTRRCMNIHQRDHFNKLYHGTNEVIYELCDEGPYQEDFLRHAPCMRHVKKDYEVCAVQYQSTMTKIGQTVATTTTTTVASSIYPTMPTHPAAVLSNGGGQYHGSDMSQHHHHRQHELSGGAHPNSTKSIEDAEEERLKTVCCAFQKYMQCSEFTVRHACGDETALFTGKFLDKMSNTLMRLKYNQVHMENHKAMH